MKFKLNRGKSIKLGDKEIPISTTDGWTDIPDDEIIEALSNAGKKHGQPDWSQEDEKDPGYIKNKPEIRTTVAQAHYMYVNSHDGDHTNDIYSAYATRAPIAVISGQGGQDSDGQAICTPVMIIFGSVSRGYCDILAISASGDRYVSTLNLMSCPEPNLHKIKNKALTINVGDSTYTYDGSTAIEINISDGT